MRIVRDATGDDWTLDLSIGNAELLENFLKDEYKVNLWSVVEVMPLLARPVPCVCIGCLLCKGERERKGLTTEQFGRRWKGTSAYNLQQSLMKEYQEFFPNPQQAEVINSALTRLTALSEREATLLGTVLTSLTNKLEQTISTMEQTIGTSSTDLSPGEGLQIINNTPIDNLRKSVRKRTKTGGKS